MSVTGAQGAGYWRYREFGAPEWVPTPRVITLPDPDNADVPRWYAPIVLTEEEAAEIRRMLDDPSRRAHSGHRLPLLDPEAVERWRATRRGETRRPRCGGQ